MVLAQLQSIRFLVVSGLIKIYHDYRQFVIDCWHQKITKAEDKIAQLVEALQADHDSSLTPPHPEDYSGMLKLRLVLSPLVSKCQAAPQDVVDKLSEAKALLEAITLLEKKEEVHFLVTYILLDLQASVLERNPDLSLRLKNLLTDYNHDLRVSPDTSGYFIGLFRLDELYIPRNNEEEDEKVVEAKLRSIVHHALK